MQIALSNVNVAVIVSRPTICESVPQDVVVSRGDTLTGDTLRSTLAEVIAQALESGTVQNMDFSLINEKGTPPAVEQLRERLAAL